MAGAAEKCRILLVEDDHAVARTVRSGLETELVELRHVPTGEDAIAFWSSFQPHLIILDLSLPDLGGLDVLARIRNSGDETRVLILTAQNEVDDRIQGLRKGADDYLGKPFSIGELGARVEALLRRGPLPEQPQVLSLADLSLSRVTRSAIRSGALLALTSREFDLLLYLLTNAGRTVSREMLARDVWRETSRYSPINNVIDVQMTRLRQKIDDPFVKKLLHTVRGVGYSLREPTS